MQVHFHLIAGWLGGKALGETEHPAVLLVASVLPDSLLMANLAARAWVKRGRGITRDDLVTWKFTYPATKVLHSLFALCAGGALASAIVPGGATPFLIGYGSHLALDYLTHARDPYPPLYPLAKSWVLSRRFSYYEPDRGAAAVNAWAWVLSIAGLCFLA